MSAKRKAAAVAVANTDDIPDAKRRKLPEVIAEKQTAEGTTRIGLSFIAQIKSARDKRHRLICTSFLTLPDKKQLPGYYEATALPIALDTIEGKLNRFEYSTLTTLESDLKRMVSNAKSYNERTSDVFSDAEKIRKMVCNYMIKANPAYRDGSGYTPFPTPIPGPKQDGSTKDEGNGDKGEDVDADGDTDLEEAVTEKPRRTVTLHGPSAEKELNRRRASSTPAVQEAEDAGESFDGNTFQQAQGKIMTELIQLKNEDGQLISGPFLNLPSRELRDYYRTIKRPQCLKGVQKSVRGVKGRDKPTGVSFFKSWQAFEDEINLIWSNARVYNEDGSAIFQLATEFETYCNRRLDEAKKAVSEPPQPKVKLRMSAKSPEPTPKIKLRFGQKAVPDEVSGIVVENDVPKIEQNLVNVGASPQDVISANGSSSQLPLKNPPGESSSGSVPTPTVSLNQTSQDRRSGSAASPSRPNGIKHEGGSAQSPDVVTLQLRPSSNASNDATHSPHPAASSMPPPTSVTPRPPSGSPHPQAATPSHHATHNQNPSNPLDSRWRQPGKDASDALISNLTIATHPALKIDHHFRLNIPPSPVASQQSVTINLPATHYCLQIIPTISPNLAHRQSKLFVSVGNSRLNPSPMKADDVDIRRPLYDTRVLPGLNRIEVEMIAGPPRGAPKVGPGQDIELEKVTVFVNILR